MIQGLLWLLEGAALAVSAVAAGWRLLHLLQLESYQLPGYWRSIRRNPARTAILPLSVAAAGILAVLIKLPLLVRVLPSCIIAFLLFKQIRDEKAKKPFAITDRVKRLLGIHVIISFMLELILFKVSAFLAVLLPGLEAGVLALAALTAQPLEKMIAQQYVNDAKARLDSMPGLIKIGITGSYGKTSTKFFLRDILSVKYRTLATPGSYNTTMGVTRVIREELMPVHEVFIAEMGARHPGDIHELCDLVRPGIGIITSIGPQHLDTFGSIEKIVTTKNELSEGVAKDGMMVFARDGAFCERLFEKCSVEKKYLPGMLLDAHDIQCGPWGTRFVLKDVRTHEEVPIETKLIGRYAVNNLMLCATVAYALGMTISEIAKGIETCKPIEHRLQLLNAGKGINIIDDAFNSNPSGATAALEVLREFPGRRIIVTPGMVELGEQEASLNYTFGTEIARSCDLVFLIGKKHCEPIRRGILDSGFNEENLFVTSSLDESTGILNNLMKQGDTILYENDLPDNYAE